MIKESDKNKEFNPDQPHGDWFVVSDSVDSSLQSISAVLPRNFVFAEHKEPEMDRLCQEALDMLAKQAKESVPRDYWDNITFFVHEMTIRWSHEQQEEVLSFKRSDDEKTNAYALAWAYFPENSDEKRQAMQNGWPW